MLFVILLTTVRIGEWEGVQKDASQETCLFSQKMSNFRELKFGVGNYIFFPGNSNQK